MTRWIYPTKKITTLRGWIADRLVRIAYKLDSTSDAPKAYIAEKMMMQAIQGGAIKIEYVGLEALKEE